uniref:DNA-directed DNA polymerase n=1 Tax=Meloidogyne incognita TaxID=6306 RepID=A0A914KXM4_MELIC
MINNLLDLQLGGGDFVKQLGEETKITKKFNMTKLNTKFLISNIPPNPEALLKGVFQECIDKALETSHDHHLDPDQLGCTVSSQLLETDIWIPIRDINNNTVDAILNQFLKVAQSKKQDNGLLWGENFSVSVTCVDKKNLQSARNIQGSGGKSIRRVNDKALIKIRNSDNFCLFYSLIASYVYSICSWSRSKFYNYMHSRYGMAHQLEKDANELMTDVGAPTDQPTYDAKEWVPKVVDYWNSRNVGLFKVFIFGEFDEKPIYKYGIENYNIPILLYFNNNHFDGVRRASDLFGEAYCLACEMIYNRPKDHATSCKAKCQNCSRIGPKYPCQQMDNYLKLCNGCSKKFYNEDCFNHHISSNFCSNSKKCEKCGVIWYVKDNNKNGRNGHVCSERYCTTCFSFHDPKRGCFIKPLTLKKSKPYRFIAFDFETMQHKQGEKGKLHEVNFISAKINCPDCIANSQNNNCKICGEDRTITFSHQPFSKTHVDQQNITNDPLIDFATWITNTSTDTVAFSHFGGRFDMVLLFKALYLQGLTPDMIKKGNKMYEMKVKNKNKSWIIFHDTYNLMPMPLASLVPAFGLQVEDKPFFPHLANNPKNYGKEIYPAKEDYLCNGMMPEKRAQFDKWYTQHKEEPFKLDEQLAAYCTNDVDILMAALISFRKEFLEVSNGLDVLRESMTIASACMKHFRLNHLKQQHVGIVPEKGYDNVDNQSLLALRFLKWYAEKNNITIRTAHSKNGEKKIGNYKLDGWIKEKKLAIEVNGCCWHGCIKCYPDDNIKLPTGLTAGQQREKDQQRLNFIKNLGVNVDVYWECEIRKMVSKDFEMRKMFKNYLDDGPINIRSAFYGGRTGPLKLFHSAQQGEKIAYYDVTSLYPFINVSTRYPVGHPEVHVINKDVNWSKPEDNIYNLSLLKLFVIPPRNIDIPVLPMKIGEDEDERLLFPLCSTCAKEHPHGDVKENYCCPHSDQQRGWVSTCTSIELNEALKEGYIVTKLFRVLEFKNYDDKLFNPYISEFMSQKIHSSGFDNSIKGDIEKEDKFMKECLEMFGIKIEREKMVANKGKRTQAKLCLNNLWGRFSLRNFGLSQCKITDDPNELAKMCDDPSITINSIDELTEEVILINYIKKKDWVEEHDSSNVIISLWTTSAARIHLLHSMQKVVRTTGCQLLYTDTDSLIFSHPTNNCPLQLGPHLGQFTDEYPDFDILEYCSGGAKQYGLKLQKKSSTNTEYDYVLKVRGMTLNWDVINNQGLCYENFKKQYPNFLRPSIKDGSITTQSLTKIYKPYVGKGIVRPSDFIVLNFGHINDKHPRILL